MEDNLKYLHWLEERWDAHKHDHFYSGAGREEKRADEIVAMLEGLVALSKRRIEAPHFPPWEQALW